jgi:hypothetical protein
MATDSGRRAAIVKSCENLRALMASVRSAATLSFMQELGRIKARAQTESESGLGRVADDLANLTRRLKEQDVISLDRWERFFGE